jgi:putative selenium metabolism protein SsnA
MATTLVNCTLASLAPRRVERGTLLIEDGRVTHAGGDLRATIAADERIDCKGRLVMPGNVCAHTHLYSALGRGMPPPARQPRNFPEILELVWWRLDRALDEATVRSSALVGILDAVRAGTTTLVDHHASPNFIDGSLDVIADGFQAIGARGVLCYEVTDRGGPERRRAGIAENARFLKRRDRRLRGLVGAHASFTLEDESLDALAGLARDTATGVHIHVAEDIFDEEDSIRRCGMRTALRLRRAGILRSQSIAAHGVHLDGEEIEAVTSARNWLVHNCRSNLNNSVGRAPVASFGLRSALGTDGIDGDMFAESRTAFFRAREVDLDTAAEQFTDMLARGAELAGDLFSLPLGRLEEGAAADLVVLDYEPPTPFSGDNLAWHWMFAMNSGMVRDVMVDGNWILRDREFTGVDEERIRADARTQAARLWAVMEGL